MPTLELEHGMRSGRRVILDTATREAADAYEFRDLDEGVKQDQRNKVLAHLLKYHDKRHFLQLLSLPDEYWTFERQLARAQHAGFTGLQWCSKTLERSISWMPGEQGRPAWFAEEIEIGTITGVRRQHCQIVFCHAGGFLQLTNADLCGLRGAEGKRQAHRWQNKYRCNTAIWLDFTSQLCGEVRNAVSNLTRWILPRKSKVPVVVSFLAARDCHASDNERVAMLVNWIGEPKYWRFVMQDVWRHQSATSPFLSVAGFFQRKEGHEVIQRDREATA